MLAQLGTRDLRWPVFQHGQSAVPNAQALRQVMQQTRLFQPTPRVTALVTAYLNDLGTSWSMQQPALLALANTGMLRAIEGPNEINNYFTGDGSHGPADTADRTKEFPANFLAWCQALHEFKTAHAAALGTALVVAPSLAVGAPDSLKHLPNVSSLVDAGNLHFYAGGGRQPNYSMRFDPFVGTFQNMLHWARQSQIPGGPVWLTECGASTSNNYARDGISQAKYLANQLFNYFSAAGRRMFIYKLMDVTSEPGDVEGNFGLFRRDGTPKPVATMLAGLQDILSLDRFDDPRNEADTAPIRPAFDAGALSVPGFTQSGAADPSCLLMPKSDGTTLIAAWNEPVIDDGKGHDIEPKGYPTTIDLGSPQRIVVHDLLDHDLQSGLHDRRARPKTAQTVELVLRGSPILIELLAPGP